MNKQEAIDSLECFRRNTAHILGDNDEKVKTIETCIMLVEEIEDETPNTPNTLNALDCISRQAAIDDLHGKDPSQVWDTADIEVWINELPSAQPEIKCIAKVTLTDEQVKEAIEKAKCEILAAQPELFTDKEQRIFLAAMGREEKVCKQVDEEWADCRDPHADTLVKVCHEIIRKVKAALWET